MRHRGGKELSHLLCTRGVDKPPQSVDIAPFSLYGAPYEHHHGAEEHQPHMVSDVIQVVKKETSMSIITM